MKFKRLADANLKGKTALVRVDFNVPVDSKGRITDDTRIRAAVPTIKAIQDAGGKVVLLSHFGRPDGKVDPELSLEFLVPTLVDILEDEVHFSSHIHEALVESMAAKEVLLLENTRFHAGETTGDKDLAQQYAALGDVYIQDAFSASHRNHVSSAVIAEYLPAYAGLNMERELDHLSQALDVPKKPVMGVVGGAKVSTKIELLSNLVEKLDTLAIGGGMANTFLFALGHKVGKSLHEPDFKDTALKIMESAKKAKCRVVGLDNVKSTEMILDAGPETVEGLLDAMENSKTLIWNGPLGAFEMTPFDTSTVEAAKYAAKLSKDGKLIAVAGGGDTVAALNHAGASDDFTFISTAGGAFLEWMEGKPLPGVEILKK